MDTRFDINSTVDTFSGLKSERRGFETFGHSFVESETDDNIQAVREKLGYKRIPEAIPDNRAQARQALYSGRTEATPQEQADYGYEAESVQEFKTSGKLFVDSAYDNSFQTVAGNRHFEDVELMPSSMTMKYADYSAAQAFEQKSETAVAVAHKPMTKKQKLTIAVYSAIAIVVGALIITTGALIGAITSDVNKMKSEVTKNQAQYTQSVDKLGAAQSEAGIKEAADSLGMTEAGTAIVVTPLKSKEPNSYSAPTNGFDKFCDWLSRIFG